MTDDLARARLSFPVKLALLSAASAATVYAVRQRRRMDFEGKIVVIAGASRGLGLELARGFARERANLVLLARNQNQLTEVERELESTGVSVSVLVCDVTKEDEVRTTVASIVHDVGRIDVLVNVAGMIQVGPVEHMNVDDFADAMAVHFWGPLYLMREVIPHMKHQRR